VPGFRPKKRLGQHFLLDPGVIHKIIDCARFNISDLVLEIGPGQGALTLPLARSVDHVVAVEKDARLVSLLKKKLSRAGITNVTLFNHDILEWNFNEMETPPSTKIKVIGNLPYNISSPFLEKLVENRSSVGRAILMFQLEIAKRLTSSPGEKTYGAMTVLIRYYAHAISLFEVPKSAFFPKPKVDSMVLELDFGRPYPKREVNVASFKEVVKGAFAHRRKTLINSLKDFFPFLDREALFEGIKKCGIDPGRRAETLNMDDFVCLASSIELTRS
jgi:16S rRNA (adenine1518-N6/adenine1519-N6)-dimethyltransferase